MSTKKGSALQPNQAIRQLRTVLISFVVVLAIPLGWLVYQVQEKFENEVFYQYQQNADDVVNGINRSLESVISPESARPYDDYTFSRVVPLEGKGGVRIELSPLAQFPLTSAVPGLLGYFQVDPDGTLRSPTVPTTSSGSLDFASLGISPAELSSRLVSYDTLSQELVQGGFALPVDSNATNAKNSVSTPKPRANSQKPVPVPRPLQSTPAAAEPSFGERADAERAIGSKDRSKELDAGGPGWVPPSERASAVSNSVASIEGQEFSSDSSGTDDADARSGAPADVRSGGSSDGSAGQSNANNLAFGGATSGAPNPASRRLSRESREGANPAAAAAPSREAASPKAVSPKYGSSPGSSFGRSEAASIPETKPESKRRKTDVAEETYDSAGYGEGAPKQEKAEEAVESRMRSQIFTQDLLLEDRAASTVLQNKIPDSKLNFDSKLYQRQAIEQSEKAKTKQSDVSKSAPMLAKESKAPTEAQKSDPAVGKKLSVQEVTATKAQEQKALEKTPKGSATGTGAESGTARSDRRQVKMLTVDSEPDPFLFRIVGDTRLFLLRKVWREGQRYLQGFVVDSTKFFDQIVAAPFEASPLSDWSSMIVGYRGVFFRRVQGDSYAFQKTKDTDQEIILTRRTLNPPFDAIEVLIAAPTIPESPGRSLVRWFSAVTALIMVLGAWAVYRLGARQIALAKERSDFVSAVSHELKTPLTSIRMYGDMLRSGWVTDDAKRQSYYDFIVSESERLSRLIANVLHLSRLSHSDAQLEVKPVSPVQLLEIAREKVAAQVTAAGFKLVTVLEPENLSDETIEASQVSIEEDAFSRIAINLVDNALKFSAHAERKEIVLKVRVGSSGGGDVSFSVRDYGPGVPRDEMKRIFQLFYRVEDEMRRNTPGTGIGLALVSELATRMSASVDLKNHEPGAEFVVSWRKR